MIIIGAGLAGLIAAHAFPRGKIYEISPGPAGMHKALLRFRSPVVGELTGIGFRPVTVRKGIMFGGKWHSPNIRLANLYSAKVIGRLIDRSVWDLDSVTRYIAPTDFYDRLIESVGDRIVWGIDHPMVCDTEEPIISTAPMPVTLEKMGIMIGMDFNRAPITVERFEVQNCEVFQTVYFPSQYHSMYRASITGDLLICEFIGEPSGDWKNELQFAFGMVQDRVPVGTIKQSFGKISPINEQTRRSAIIKLTLNHNIFSLGRFATWRNILLDDVVHDIAVIKRLANASHYERKLEAAKEI